MHQPCSPLELVARAAPGPHTTIRFVHDPFRVVPLSVLVIHGAKRTIGSLPVYDVDGSPYAALATRRNTELELPRFELSFPEGLASAPVAVETPPAASAGPADLPMAPIPLTSRRMRPRRAWVAVAAAVAVLLSVSTVGLLSTPAHALSVLSTSP
jgi:hypothetical protein